MSELIEIIICYSAIVGMLLEVPRMLVVFTCTTSMGMLLLFLKNIILWISWSYILLEGEERKESMNDVTP